MSAQAASPGAHLNSVILEAWIAERREIMARERCLVRGGPGRTIEVQLVERTGHVFQPLTGPDGLRTFGTEAERDEIVRRLQATEPSAT